MKLKPALIFIVPGFCIDFVGALLKIQHAPNADILLIPGTILKVAGTILLLYKILTQSKAKNLFSGRAQADACAKFALTVGDACANNGRRLR